MSTENDSGAVVEAQRRIPDGGFRELGLINWVASKIAARVIGAPKMHMVTTLGRHKRLFWAWFVFGAVVYAGRLPRADTELVILRVAHLRGCEYELQQHRRFGARRGVPPEVQEKIFAWPGSEGLSPRRQALLNATDEFINLRTITRATWDVLSGHLTTRQLIEFCMLAGQYDALSATMSALEIPLDYPDEQAAA
jgi:4-carboxymuconolactone decarboxylase